MQRSLLPEGERKWQAPPVERSRPLSANVLARELKRHAKSIAKVLNAPADKSSYAWLDSFMEEWARSMLDGNAEIPLSAGERAGVADLLEWVEDIGNKRSPKEAEEALKKSLAYFLGRLGKKGDEDTLLQAFRDNPDILHVRSYSFMRVDGVMKCVKMFEPGFFADLENADTWHMRSLLSNGTPFSYGSALLINLDQHKDPGKQAEILDAGREMIRLALQGSLEGAGKNMFRDALASFMAQEMDDGDRCACLENAAEVTEAMAERIGRMRARESGAPKM